MPRCSSARLFAGFILLPLLLPAQAPALDPACRPADPPAVCQHLAAQVAVLDAPTNDVVWDELLTTARLAQRYPKSPGAWLALAQARQAASTLRIKAVEGPLQTGGESFTIGAGNALVRALELDSSDAPAAEALAHLPLPTDGAHHLKKWAAALKRHVALLSPTGVAAAAGLQREVGDRREAVTLWREALLKGYPHPGLLRMELARDLHALDSAAAGARSYFAGIEDTSTATVAAYTRELRWLGSPEELEAWEALAPEERPNWLAGFWGTRDVAEGRAEGARLAEHYRRLEYALTAYRLRVSATGGRHRIKSTSSSTESLSDSRELRELRAEGNVTSEQEMDLLRFLDQDAVTLGSNSAFFSYRSSQDLLDDRGVVYVRHGAPEQRKATIGGVAMEIWRYQRHTGDIVLSFKEVDFDGQAGASVLVPTLLTEDPYFRDQLCAIDVTLCPLKFSVALPGASQNNISRFASEARRLRSGVQLNHSRTKGLEAIQTATETDDFVRPIERTLSPLIQIYGLTHLTSDGPRLVASFAIPGEELTATQPATANGRYLYPISIRLDAVRRSDGVRFGVDTLRHFATTVPVAKGAFLVGTVELPVAPGEWTASLTLATHDGRLAVANLGRVTAPAVGGVVLSDLVFGKVGGGAEWSSGRSRVSLNPLNTFTERGEAAVYVQVRGIARDASYRAVFEFFDGNDDAADVTPKLTLSFTEQSPGGIQELQRTLGLGQLKPGGYRVRLTVTAEGGTATSEGWLRVVK
ncbi:MAG: hypothetical protein SFU57_00950 [Gemmatimonadales bacterium]|nr:hypothetical protein [Gemmatimonadales bacterium]